MKLEPARQGQGGVDEEGIEAEADDVDGDRDEEDVDGLNQSDGEDLGALGRDLALRDDPDHRLGHDDPLVNEQRERSDESAENGDEHDIAAGGQKSGATSSAVSHACGGNSASRSLSV